MSPKERDFYTNPLKDLQTLSKNTEYARLPIDETFLQEKYDL